MKITKSQLKQIIKEELESVTEMFGGPRHDLKVPRITPQDREDDPDVISRAAAGDIDMLQAFEEMIELKGGSKDELHDTLARLLGMVEKDPDITSDENL
jgi:hypothetical protein